MTATNVTSTGNSALLKATTGNITATTITANGSYIQLLAPAGTITVSGAITGTNVTQIFQAKNSIGLKGGVTNNGAGDVRIFASQGGGSTAFVIGSSSSNGVTSVKNNGVNGGTIYISNGSSSGGITYTGGAAPGKLQSQGSGGQAGNIILDGGSSNKITLSGNLNADGSGSNRSGGVLLFAPEVISNGATLSANSPNQLVGSIGLTTNKITDNSGLTLSINGNGPFSNYVDLSITPVGSWSVTAKPDPATPITFGSFTSSSNPLTITGAGAFVINANGTNNGLKIWGPSLTITTASTKITQQGGGNGIYLSAWDGGSTSSMLTLTGDIQIKENTTAKDQAQNLIQIDPASIAPLTHNVLLDASGTNDGDGSNINLSTSTGALSLGDSTTDFQLNANGGAQGGKGGTVNVFGGAATVTIKSGNAVVASALGGNGDGGLIDIESASISNSTGATTNINANSKGTGNGSTAAPNIKLAAGSGTLNLGTGTGKLALAATGTDGTGNGGMIEIANFPTITLSNELSVAAGTGAGGKGTGGSINIHDFGSFQVIANSTPKLTADGRGSGQAGTITILSQNSNPIVLDGATLSASGDTNGNGAGNAINVTGLGSISLLNTVINANGGGTGGDAGSVLLGVYDVNAQAIDVSTAQINANATLNDTSTASNGAGGRVTVSFAKGAGTNTIDIQQVFKVDSGSNASDSIFGGSISLNSNANGDPIVCQQVKNSVTVWPKTYYYCGHDVPNKLTVVLGTLQGLPVASLNAMPTTNPPPVFVFFDVDEVNAFLVTSEGTEVNSGTSPVGGWTHIDGATGKIRVMVVEALEQGPVVLTLGNTAVAAVARHEVAHVLDQQFGSVVGRAWVSLIGGGLQNSFNGFVSHDFRNLTFQAPNYTVALPACGTGAMFQGATDPRSGNQICPLSGDLVGKNNQQILQILFAYYTTLDSNQRWRETWAEEYATFSGPSSNQVDSYFSSYFACTKIYIDALRTTGALAPLSAYPASCTN